MTDNLKTYKFVFTAEIGVFRMNAAKISCPLYVSWKRSQQTAISQIVDLTEGKADFKNQVLKLPVNMYFDEVAQCFQEKKSSFSFQMKTPKGEKTAGVAYYDLSKMLNNKMDEYSEDFPIEKCPVKDSKVNIKITAECIGQRASDSMSQASVSMITPKSSMQIEAQKIEAAEPVQEDKDSEVNKLRAKIEQLTKENTALKKQLEMVKTSVKGDSLKQQLLKSKSLQNRLEEEVNNLRKQNLEHEKQIEGVRTQLEQVYSNLYSSLSNHYL